MEFLQLNLPGLDEYGPLLIMGGLRGGKEGKREGWRGWAKGGAEAEWGDQPLSQYCEVEGRWRAIPHILSQRAHTEAGAAASPGLGSWSSALLN